MRVVSQTVVKVLVYDGHRAEKFGAAGYIAKKYPYVNMKFERVINTNLKQ